MVEVDTDGRIIEPFYPPPPRRLQPKFEWEDEGGSHVLYVHLPEFDWKELKLTPKEPTRSLKVEGTHQTETYSYIWFDIDIRIPDSATFNKMWWMFQKKTLIVTFPKQTTVLTPQQPLPPPQAKDPVSIPTPRSEPLLPLPPPPPPQAKDPVPIPTPPNEPPPPPLPLLPPPQAKDPIPIPIPTPCDEPPPALPQAKEPVPIPTLPNEPPPPPLPLPPPPQAKDPIPIPTPCDEPPQPPPHARDPVPIPTPCNEPRKVEERINEGPGERDSHMKLQPLGEKGAGSGATTTIHSTEMKVGMEEERKLMVNVLMASIVLVAIGAYIYATLTLREEN